MKGLKFKNMKQNSGFCYSTYSIHGLNHVAKIWVQLTAEYMQENASSMCHLSVAIHTLSNQHKLVEK